ncbi:ArnT family glycosyltransferase [Curtobacterium caseinilyticum]|uniref:Glycosyltransferase family 39 protein n=1 Tax=Curtobacterium caseinilyticum TaxID=3055137 RepID=A0ABT7TPJ0_9MICO|nr:glycosyltransferase family 39 protein [Curtobacterium caseinilyticum]MDM7891520.1 glycosyltransferase family 39 protein [Curtobacterium caseinilyticum]
MTPGPQLLRHRLDTRATRLAALVLVAVWALYQCTWNLLGHNVHGDESIYVRAGWSYVHGDFAANREHPPTGKYLFGAAQLLLGQGVLGPRIAVAVLVLVVGATLYWWLRNECGHWTGLLAAGAWLLTPRDFLGSRVDRYALLDPVMICLAVLALATAWAWIRTGRGWLAPLSGVLFAMSVTTKVSTVVLLPAFVLLPLLFRQPRRLLTGGVAWLVAFVLVTVALYAPMGMRSAIAYMVRFQDGQNEHGHPLSIAGTVHTFAPWWANAWFLWNGVGAATTVTLLVGLVAAVVLRPGRLVAYLGTALGCLVVFYTVVAHIALANYYAAWMPLLVAVAAIGLGRLVTALPRPTGVVVAGAVVVALAVPSAVQSVTIAETRPTGIAVVDTWLRDHGRARGGVLFAAATPTLTEPYFAGRGSMEPDDGPFVALVVGDDRRFPPSDEVERFLDDRGADLSRHEVDGFTVWTPRSGTIVQRDGVLTVAR